jgi:hypothetical protein
VWPPGGVSLCIDTTLHILEMLGEQVASDRAADPGARANKSDATFLAG